MSRARRVNVDAFDASTRRAGDAHRRRGCGMTTVIVTCVMAIVTRGALGRGVDVDVDRGARGRDVGWIAPRRALMSFGSTSGASAATHREHLSTGVSKELVERVAKDGAVIVTWANSHYYDFAVNWLRHLDAVGVTNYLIGAMDEEMYEKLRKIGVPCWLMGSKGIDKDAVKRDFGWGSKNFHKMGRDKIRLIHDFTKTGTDVLISDIDVSWLRDPIPFFRRYPKADILVSSDNLRNSTHSSDMLVAKHVDGEGLEAHPCAGTANIGMMWFRSTPGSQAITEEWVRNLEADDKIWDQAEFNKLMHLGGCGGGSADEGNGVGKAYNGKVNMGTLPVALFNNGHTFFTQRLHEALNVNPYAMHATFQYEGTPGKRNRMREANQWLGDKDNSEYFEQKFLSYTPRVLSDVNMQMFEKLGYPSYETPTLKEGDPVILEHMRLVQHQIGQLYEAAAIAKKLGRVLIAPPFFCGLDRVWFPHGGRFPGSMLELPFICPLDHVMAIESYGPNFAKEYREYSFLGHPDMPEGFVSTEKVRRVQVPPTVSFSKTSLIDDKYGMCFRKHDETGNLMDTNGDACVPARNAIFQSAETVALSGPADNLDSLSISLESVKDVPFLHFDTIIGVTKQSQAGTTNQIRMGIWCCRHGSHEYYKLDKVELFLTGDVPAITPKANQTEPPSVKRENADASMNSTETSDKETAPEDDPLGRDLENKDAQEEIQEADDTWEGSKSENATETATGTSETAIEAGLMEFFKGDLKKVYAAMHLISEAHKAGLDQTS